MGKTQAEIEFEQTLAKLRELAGMEPLPVEKPIPIERPIKKPFPTPRREEPETSGFMTTKEEEYFDEPRYGKPFKKLPTEKFDIPEDKKKGNPWIVVAVVAIVALVALGGYFTYTLSKQEPVQTNLNMTCPAQTLTCPANSNTCTCTPIFEGSNLTCQPITNVKYDNLTGS